MAIPSKLPEWDTTQVNIIEVDQQHKDEGWAAPEGVPEEPSFQSFNWWQNLVYQWILRFKNVTGGLNNATELLSFPETVDATSVNVRGYTTVNDGGGGIFNYDSSIYKSTANGGTIIDPSQTLANQGNGVGTGCWIRQLEGDLNVIMMGAKGDGVTDNTTFIQKAIYTGLPVLIPKTGVFVSDSISLSSDKILKIEGTLLRKPNSADDTHFITNTNGTGGNSNIKIIGSGKIDGNYANQTSTFRQSLIYFFNCSQVTVKGLTLTGNILNTTSASGTNVNGCFYIVDGSNIVVSDIYLYNWGREGISIDGAITHSIISNIIAYGWLHSWSAVQLGGPGSKYNIINNITAKDCGASSVGMDSEYSTCNNIVSYNNRYQNGVNFGHNLAPSNHSTATNIVVHNAGSSATSGATHNGISISNGTEDFTLTNITVDICFSNGINVSNLAKKVHIDHTTVSNAGLFGINLYNADDSTVSNSNFINNTNPYNFTGSLYIVKNTRFSNEPLSGNYITSSLAAGTEITLSNANITPFSVVNWYPRHKISAEALFYQSGAIDTGNFKLTNSIGTDGTYSRIDYNII